MKITQCIAVTAFAAFAASAATTSFTSTGWVTAVPVMGVWCTNALGQVYVRSLVHSVRVQSTDPRLSGNRLITVNGGYNADGTASLQGASYHQVGTWNGTNFVPSGGVWEINYQGVMQTDNSLLLHLVGYGIGGAIEGLRLDETMTRAATTSILDPTVPYLYTGTIQPPPTNTTLVHDDFSGPEVAWAKYGPDGSYSYVRTNGQLVVRGYWLGTVTHNVPDTYTIGGPSKFDSVVEGQSMEVRADLVSLNPSATAARLVLGTDSGFYSFFKGHDFMAVSKWSANLASGPVILFFYEKAQVPDTNVTLTLAWTKANGNVVLTARALAQSSANSVLYARSVVDTPGVDPTLTSAELYDLSGMSLTLSPDIAGAPITSGGAAIGVWQYNYDGHQPAAVATYDNLELVKYDVPQLGIERAVRLSWPGLTGMNWTVEAAPTPRGLWSRIQQADWPGMSQMTVPASAQDQVFRLIQAP